MCPANQTRKSNKQEFTYETFEEQFCKIKNNVEFQNDKKDNIHLCKEGERYLQSIFPGFADLSQKDKDNNFILATFAVIAAFKKKTGITSPETQVYLDHLTAHDVLKFHHDIIEESRVDNMKGFAMSLAMVDIDAYQRMVASPLGEMGMNMAMANEADYKERTDSGISIKMAADNIFKNFINGDKTLIRGLEEYVSILKTHPNSHNLLADYFQDIQRQITLAETVYGKYIDRNFKTKNADEQSTISSFITARSGEVLALHILNCVNGIDSQINSTETFEKLLTNDAVKTVAQTITSQNLEESLDKAVEQAEKFYKSSEIMQQLNGAKTIPLSKPKIMETLTKGIVK